MNDWYEQFEAHYKAEMAKQKDLQPGLVKGKIIQVNVADGYAYYEVMRVNTKTVRIKWRYDLSADGYQYMTWGEGGLVERGLLAMLIEGTERLVEMMARTKD